jgi:mannose-6-phosphate isomerase-like protein (cupin superfamily)
LRNPAIVREILMSSMATNSGLLGRFSKRHQMTTYVPRTSSIDNTNATHVETALSPSLFKVDLSHIASDVTETYKNFVVFRVNDHCLRMAVMEGEYRWHRHPHSDECFLTLEGCLEIDLEDGRTIKLMPSESFVIPAGTLHRTRSNDRSVILCFEHLAAYTDVEFAELTEIR